MKKEYYNKCKKLNVCPNHVGRPSVLGKTMCQECLDSFVNRYNERLKKGVCTSHPDQIVIAGKTRCQKCVDATVIRDTQRIKECEEKGACFSHPDRKVATDRGSCQECLDNHAVSSLPKKARDAARKRANSTRKDRVNGTYRCPVYGMTEKELRERFPSNTKYSFWSFDHIGNSFRDIISRRANYAVGTLASYELSLGVDYVKKHEDEEK